MVKEGNKVTPFSSNLPCSNLIYSYWHSQSHWLSRADSTPVAMKKAQAVLAGSVQRLSIQGMWEASHLHSGSLYKVGSRRSLKPSSSGETCAVLSLQCILLLVQLLLPFLCPTCRTNLWDYNYTCLD